MYSNETNCPGCGASITATNDVDFIEIDTQEAELLSNVSKKKMYVVACGICEAILGGVGALS